MRGGAYEPDLKEIRERLTRMESRMVQLGDYVGANLRAKLRITPKVGNSPDELFVEVDSFDVSISRLLAEMKDRGWSGDIGVEIRGVHIATMHIKPE